MPTPLPTTVTCVPAGIQLASPKFEMSFQIASAGTSTCLAITALATHRLLRKRRR
jgi:hypothetical protein